MEVEAKGCSTKQARGEPEELVTTREVEKAKRCKRAQVATQRNRVSAASCGIFTLLLE